MSRERARSDCSYTWTGKVFVKIKKFFQEQTDMDCLNQQLQWDGVLITIVQKYFTDVVGNCKIKATTVEI
jgi:hypothetical protein